MKGGRNSLLLRMTRLKSHRDHLIIDDVAFTMSLRIFMTVKEVSKIIAKLDFIRQKYESPL